MPVTTVYFISETAPVNTHASSVVFYRHLKKLSEDGYRVVWITDNNSYQAAKGNVEQWESIVLPNRQWHLPPYRGKGLAQLYRFNYYYRNYLKQHIQKDNAILITHISGQFLAPFSAFVHRRTNLPLVSFFHDDILELNFHKNAKTLIQNTQKVLEASSIVLTVSKAFENNWPQYASKFRILYPVPHPHKVSGKPKTASKAITVGYSGAIYDETLPYFKQVLQNLKGADFKLVIIGDRKKTDFLSDLFPESLTCIDLFDTPAEASQFLVDNCDAMLIPYPGTIAEMPWIATCYPSKFIQYCQLNLPTMIIAPTSSAIGEWCITNQWGLYSDSYESNSLHKLLNNISSQTIITQMANLNAGEFKPERIFQELDDILQSILKQHN
ncbi:hypothetical protein D0C36_08800 [Mucilaginibacter conchicola]|uniref:Glycosyltransferase subfamily 4-like N-terminal domain-containing protein n=1 Tax=Mucilaginibacter conchicola TaxID=2303333 RepID=A0A372NZN8_9SPHI|nr:glycosyltransferase [Mucilaginibacter conchicola]RFZ95598.1 hypothetical protein D0C36_08800 [Mucilaginibacter conchicola]